MRKIIYTLAFLILSLPSLATTFYVMNSNSTGAGSLLEAINAMNTDPSATMASPHLIDFSLLNDGDNRFNLVGQLQCRRPVIVDGGTHPDSYIILESIAPNSGPFINLFNVGGLNPEGTIVRNIHIGGDLTRNGIQVEGVNNVSIENCLIGTVDGNTPSPLQNGLMVFGGANNITIRDNIISGNNSNGIFIESITTTNVLIENNLIGLNSTGDNLLGNNANGIHILASTFVTIKDNTIAGNGSNGVLLENTNNNLVEGNIIGLANDKLTPYGNGANGVEIFQGSNNIIGGNLPGRRNIISANLSNGIRVFESSDNIVLGNFIGTDGTGSLIRSNFQGVNISGASSAQNIIGDTTFLGRNVISANSWHGIFFEGATHDNYVYGNYIGTDSLGLNANGNGRNGISGTIATDQFIGGNTPKKRNIISGNGFNTFLPAGEGPWFSGVSFLQSDGLYVNGNYIGLGSDGTTEIANANYGIWFVDGDNLDVGGNDELSRNIISGNGSNALTPNPNQTDSPEFGSSRGIYIQNSSTIRIDGNYIGTDHNGEVAKPNLADGIAILNSNDIAIGTRQPNLISGNTFNGIHLFQNQTVTIENNIFGLASDGVTMISNLQDGVYLNHQNNTQISSNIISGNGQLGIQLYESDSNKIYQNVIGLDVPKQGTIGNGAGGLKIMGEMMGKSNVVTKNIITGSLGSSNVSTLGNGYGIYVAGNGAIENKLSLNEIYCNNGLPVNLQLTGSGFGSTTPGNAGKIAPNVYTNTSYSTQTSGSGEPGDSIELYSYNPSCGCGAEILLGQSIVNPEGEWMISHAPIDSLFVSAISTSEQGNTSQLSCKKAVAGSIINISSVCQGDSSTIGITNFQAAELIWQIAIEGDFEDIIYQESTGVESDTVFINVPFMEEKTHFIRVISSLDQTRRDTTSITQIDVTPRLSPGSIITNSNSPCLNETVNISINSNTTTSYRWFESSSNGWVEMSGQNSNSISPVITQNQSFYAEAIGLECSLPSDSISITPLPQVEGTLSISSSSNPICSGQLWEANSIADNLGDNASFQWYINDIPSDIQSNSFSLKTLKNGDEIYLRATPDTACATADAYLSNSIFVETEVNLTPTISISGNTFLCHNETTLIESTANHEGNSPSYQWYLNNELLKDITPDISLPMVTNGDSLIAVLKSDLRCSTIDSAISNTLIFNIAPTSEFSISIDPYNKCIEENSALNLSLSSTIATDGIDSLIWYLNGTREQENAFDFSFIPKTSDSVSVYAYSANPCLNTSIAITRMNSIDFSTAVIADAGEDIVIDKLSDVELNGSNSINATNFKWDYLITESASVTLSESTTTLVTPTNIGVNKYLLTASNEHCSDTSHVTITLSVDIDIPNAFSPNDDGQHDRWVINNSEAYSDIEIHIYNRWGTLLYHVNQGEGYTENNAWDGTFKGEILPVASYYYVIDLHNGSNASAGTVSILR